ncbi:glycosyltransferase 87 family protein [Kocuria sp. M1R5S2]|uniref:glycosyltransferase 87 family protein n=1 Tax=Kocuria rhizosphaerae TaxID=3376285 RepID=UPI0037BBCD08
MKATVLVLWYLAFMAVRAAFLGVVHGSILGQDAHAYWTAAQSELIYDKVAGERDAYLYSPVVMQVIRPLAVLPWPAFLALWIGLQSGVLMWLLKPLHWKWAVPLFLFCVPELVIGNVLVLLAASVVIGLRYPVAWAFPALTKITTGAGFLWFVVRGEWRRVLQGIGGISLIVGVSYLFEPASWHAWVQFLLTNRGGTPHGAAVFAAQILLAVVLIVVGARKDQPWLLAPALVLGMPVLVNFVSLTLLMSIPRLLVLGDQLRGQGPHSAHRARARMER